jgi:hypothetical protein
MRIDLFLHQQGIDTTTPAGKAMYQLMGVFAEFERSMIIQERVRAGLKRAVSEGQSDSPRVGKTNPCGSKGAWPPRLAVWSRSWHSAADRPPFRARKRPRRVKDARLGSDRSPGTVITISCTRRRSILSSACEATKRCGAF